MKNVELQLKAFLQQPYSSSQNFLQNVIFPVFGEEFFESSGNLNVLKKRPELRPKAENSGILEIRNVGRLLVDGSELDIFDITLDSKKQLQRNRVEIQQIIRSIISTLSGAFILFHYQSGARWEWRFTFCHKGSTADENTDAKRYTFLLGPGQSCRTAAENFVKIHEKIDREGEFEMADIIRAFDVEALSKEFFEKYKAHYEKFCNYVYANRNDSTKFGPAFAQCDEKTIRDYVKKLLGRLVFLQFLQKKGWLGGKSSNWNDGDRDFLQNLYKNSTQSQKDDFLDAVLEPLFQNALDHNRAATNQDFDTGVEGFRCCKIPYLNGGLFSKDQGIDDANSDFPAEYFGNLFEFFYQYNFTIDENDPNDAEVGVDPEMLGRIFENLLEDNKDKGAFYTPKAIVQYMCKESLIAYLQNGCKTERARKAARDFVESHDAEPLRQLHMEKADGTKVKDSVLEHFDKMLRAVKVCDPAIGSGAFPMGMLRELFECRAALEDYSVSTPADIKKDIIQNNIYGVDIEKGAVDIARLRFWLTLILDEEDPHALPNLDFKIMQGNSLLESFHGVDLSNIAVGKQKATKALKVNARTLQGSILFEDEEAAMKELQRNLRQYYSTDNHDQKKYIHAKIESATRQYLIHKTEGRPDLQAEVEILPLCNDQFFLWHTFFADVFEQGGFDIVIGNPPYITMTKNNTDNDVLKAYIDGFVSIKRCYSKNIYTLFIELGVISLLKSKGILSYIIPEGLFKTRSYEDCVSMMKSYGDVLSYSTFENYVFENAVTGSLIFKYRKEKLGANPVHFAFDGKYNISIVPEEDTSIFDKITKDTKDLKDIANLFKGMVVKDRQSVVFENKENNSDIFLLGKSISKWAIKTPFYTNYECLTIIGGTKKKVKHDVAPRIVIRRTGDTLCCSLLETPALTESTLYSCWSKNNTIDNKFLIAILNSRLIDFYNKKKNITNQQGFPQILMTDLEGLPVKVASKAQQLPIITLVDQILFYKKSNPLADTSFFEAEIDRLVYQLYGLTEEEIKIVEGKQ